jgi:hypothetical protein
MSRIRNLGLVFTSPGTVARSVAEDPHWLIPFVVVLAAILVVSLSTLEYQQREAQAAMMERVRDTGTDTDDMPDVSGFMGVFMPVIAVGGLAVMILLASAILNGIASLAGGRIGFRKMLAYYSYASVITVVGSLIKVPLILAKGSMDVRISAAAFAPSVSLHDPLGAFLNWFDVFSIWMLVALTIGYGVLAGFKTKKSALIVFGLWGVVVALSVGATALRTATTGTP